MGGVTLTAPSPVPEVVPSVTGTERAASRGQPRAWPDRHTGLKVFIGGLVLNLTAAVVLEYGWHIGNLDGLARTANAFYVLYARDPHLAAIGFVWPVLPSLVQLPLLEPLRAVGHPELAGAVMSAAAGAGVLVVLSHVLGLLGVRGWTRLVWLALVQLHPLFWLHAAIGLAEAPLMLCLALAVLAYLRLPSVLAAALLGLSLMLGCFIRYEMLAFVAGSAVALLLQVPWRPRWRDWGVYEARLIIVLTPPLYAMALWLLANWAIMGDPLYFARSVYSLAAAPEVARNAGPSHPLWEAMGSLPLTAAYALKRVTQVNVALPIAAALALWVGFRHHDRRLLGLLALVGSMFAFTALQVFQGSLPPMMRYWASATPFAVVLAGAGVHAWRAATPTRSQRLWPHAFSVLLLAAVGVNLVALGDPHSMAPEEQRLSAVLLGDTERARVLLDYDRSFAQRHDASLVAAELNRLSGEGLTLIDTETGFAAILQARRPDRLVINTDRDFREILDSPPGHVRFIAVTEARPGALREQVNEHLPGLWEGRVPWARLVRQLEGTMVPWRIYEVLAPAPVLPDPVAKEPLPAGSPPAGPEPNATGAPAEPAAAPALTPQAPGGRAVVPVSAPSVDPSSAELAWPADESPASEPVDSPIVPGPESGDEE